MKFAVEQVCCLALILVEWPGVGRLQYMGLMWPVKEFSPARDIQILLITGYFINFAFSYTEQTVYCSSKETEMFMEM